MLPTGLLVVGMRRKVAPLDGKNMDAPFTSFLGSPVGLTACLVVLALQGCGGGSASQNVGASSGGREGDSRLIAQPENLGSNLDGQTATLYDAPSPPSDDEVVALPGWSLPEGARVQSTSNLNVWAFSSQKATSWVPGSISLSSVDGQSYVKMDYDFGCNVPSVRLREADCRNVVSLSTTSLTQLDASPNGVIALTLRNVDAGAEFALRVRDSNGQTLQYPLQIRTIENQDRNKWSMVRVALRYPSVYWGGSLATTPGVPGGAISAISLVAAPRNSDSGSLGLSYPRGSLEIKSATYFVAGGSLYKLQTNAPLNAEGVIPSLDGRFAIAHNSFDISSLQRAKDAGFNVVRRSLSWSTVERNGVYSHASFAHGAENLATLSMKVLWILAYGHPDHGGDVPLSSSDRLAYSRFAANAAEFWQTRSLKGFEVWNEPHLAAYWPNPDAAAYGAMLGQAGLAIKSIDANIPVVSAGIAIDELSYLYKLAQGGYLNNVDAIGIHPYRKDSYLTAVPTFKRSFSTPEMYANDRLITKYMLASLGVTKPLWNTESGYSSIFFLDPSQYPDPHSESARNRQGQLILRHVLSQIALNEPLITIYRLFDSSVSTTDKEENFGLIDALGNEKPAYKALKNFTELTKTKAYKGFHSDTPPGTHALRWQGSRGGVICVWSESIGETVSIDVPLAVKRIVSWSGVELPRSSSISLTEARGPVYFLY